MRESQTILIVDYGTLFAYVAVVAGLFFVAGVAMILAARLAEALNRPTIVNSVPVTADDVQRMADAQYVRTMGRLGS